MENLLLIKIPEFHPKYRKWEKYGYKNPREKACLRRRLEECSEGYCMYCYTRVHIDRNLYAELEHGIEKTNSLKLEECIPDIGLACPNCNQKLKKVGERKRRISKDKIDKFESESKCTSDKRKQCTVSCKALRNLQKEYSQLPGAEIILQPMGIKGADTGKPMMLQYDILNMEFQPASQFYTYSDKEIDFMEAHIKRFCLNDIGCKTRQLVAFIEDIIDNEGKILEREYDNWVVNLFKRKIENMSRNERMKICGSIYPVIFCKGAF